MNLNISNDELLSLHRQTHAWFSTASAGNDDALRIKAVGLHTDLLASFIQKSIIHVRRDALDDECFTNMSLPDLRASLELIVSTARKLTATPEAILETSTVLKSHIASFFPATIDVPLVHAGRPIAAVYKLDTLPEEDTYFVQAKMDGIRVLVATTSKRAWLAHTFQEITPLLEPILNHANLPSGALLDCELVDCTPNPHEDSVQLSSMQVLPDTAKLYVFDAPYFNLADQREQPLSARIALLDSLISTDSFVVMNSLSSLTVYNPEDLQTAIDALTAVPFSEGAVLKADDGFYEDQSMSSWYKVKPVREVYTTVCAKLTQNRRTIYGLYMKATSTPETQAVDDISTWYDGLSMFVKFEGTTYQLVGWSEPTIIQAPFMGSVCVQFAGVSKSLTSGTQLTTINKPVIINFKFNAIPATVAELG